MENIISNLSPEQIDAAKLTLELEALRRENARLKADIATLSAQFGAVMQTIKQGVPVPAAMVPQEGVPGLTNFQPLQTGQPVGLPLPGEPQRLWNAATT